MFSEKYLMTLHSIVDPWRDTGDFDEKTKEDAHKLSCIDLDGTFRKDRYEQTKDLDDPMYTISEVDRYVIGGNPMNAKYLSELVDKDAENGSEMSGFLHRTAFSLDCCEKGMDAKDLEIARTKIWNSIYDDVQKKGLCITCSGRLVYDDVDEYIIDAVRFGDRAFFDALYKETRKSYNDAEEEPIVQKMCALSTAHITKGSDAWLDDQALSNTAMLPVYEKEGGYFIPLPIVDDVMKSVTIPDDVRCIINYAMRNGCNWLMLDGDVMPVNALPIYNWD